MIINEFILKTDMYDEFLLLYISEECKASYQQSEKQLEDYKTKIM
jgi:hypothetical protein